MYFNQKLHTSPLSFNINGQMSFSCKENFCLSLVILLSLSLILFVSVQTMQAARCPTDELSLTNCAVVSEKDLQSGQ